MSKVQIRHKLVKLELDPSQQFLFSDLVTTTPKQEFLRKLKGNESIMFFRYIEYMKELTVAKLFF